MEEEIQHMWVKTNGIKLHVAEQRGKGGPLVLLLHGFPEIWYAWRHQIPFLASHGYHVVAPDLRGYGDSDAPLSPSSYTMLHIVADLIGLLDHFGEPTAFVVGIDWGALAAWYMSLFRPDRVKGVICLAVPYSPRDPSTKPTDSYRQFYGNNFYVCQFQEPGRAESAFARLSNTPSILPPWITEEELQVYADKFQESGFTGPFNYYRALDLNWELLAPWQGAKITVPAKFIIGKKDIGFENLGTKDYIEGSIFKSIVPNLQVVILDSHHFIQLEKPQEVSNEILSFLQDISSHQ
ncbi:Epoxide hydrolase A [Bienertia sinuspersici]